MTRRVSRVWLTAGVTVAMVFFAGNSVLCRLALGRAEIDPASFTLLRLASGAIVLGLIVALRLRTPIEGSWPSALALFGYAAGFSLAYTSLPAGIGAFVLFATVQATMIVAGVAAGKRTNSWQLVGIAVALAGLALLLMPGSASFSPAQASFSAGSVLMMVCAGAAWGAYSILGRQARNPVAATAGNFVRATVIGLVGFGLYAALGDRLHLSSAGMLHAVLSGAVTSGVGYSVWYAVLPSMTPTAAASVQLSVPVITALVGVAALGEALSWRLAFASAAVLGGIALVVAGAGGGPLSSGSRVRSGRGGA